MCIYYFLILWLNSLNNMSLWGERNKSKRISGENSSISLEYIFKLWSLSKAIFKKNANDMQIYNEHEVVKTVQQANVSEIISG